MSRRYLQITYRKGKPLAAYLQLTRAPGVKAVRSDPVSNGLVVDYSQDGAAIGIEITSPATITAEQIDGVLANLGLPPLGLEEFSPLAA